MAASIGAGLNRVDGRLKVSGGARYAGEEPIAHVAHGVLIQSTIGKGRVDEIDTGAAERAPGVLLVLTARNAPKLPGARANSERPGEVYPLLQDDTVDYNGQHIGLLVAETFEQATHAARLVAVRYAEEPPLARLEQALDNAAVPRHFRNGTREPGCWAGQPGGGCSPRAGQA
jgi:xanthine dehydrogenase YagR molybdenum-binding subunit